MNSDIVVTTSVTSAVRKDKKAFFKSVTVAKMPRANASKR